MVSKGTARDVKLPQCCFRGSRAWHTVWSATDVDWQLDSTATTPYPTSTPRSKGFQGFFRPQVHVFHVRKNLFRFFLCIGPKTLHGG